MSKAPRVLQVEAGGQAFGIEIAAVRALDRIQRHVRLPGAPSYVVGVVEVRGEAVALIHLATRLGLEASPLRRHQPLVVIDSEEPVALAVDRIVGLTEVGADALSEGDSGPLEKPSGPCLGTWAGLRVLDAEAIVDGRPLDPLPASDA
ncbi:MAG: chemotaxis protein CheW [Planctomycetes bacterium]|nr:chemotaxis protein CheW [Planctomycetota bacterium]